MITVPDKTVLPWDRASRPLMLAPMQGITNRALRRLFIERVQPDVVFTEFIRVQPGRKKVISKGDCLEVTDSNPEVPLVVQLIGNDTEALVAVALKVQDLGAMHLNINLGCPYGRMTSRATGGALLADPKALAFMLSHLRRVVSGSFSIKTRAGLDDSSLALARLGLFEDCGVDFLILHPRTVQQGYQGRADHTITAAMVNRTTLPVIANGDVMTAADGEHVLAQTNAAGLMLGRGAIADPLLFQRLRGKHPTTSTTEQRQQDLRDYLQDLLLRYHDLFHGDQQVLAKMKEVLGLMYDTDLAKMSGQLKKCRSVARFGWLLQTDTAQ